MNASFRAYALKNISLTFTTNRALHWSWILSVGKHRFLLQLTILFHWTTMFSCHPREERWAGPCNSGTNQSAKLHLFAFISLQIFLVPHLFLFRPKGILLKLFYAGRPEGLCGSQKAYKSQLHNEALCQPEYRTDKPCCDVSNNTTSQSVEAVNKYLIEITCTNQGFGLFGLPVQDWSHPCFKWFVIIDFF